MLLKQVHVHAHAGKKESQHHARGSAADYTAASMHILDHASDLTKNHRMSKAAGILSIASSIAVAGSEG